MVTTNDGGLWERAWSYKDHGKNYGAVHRPEPERGFRWVHDQLGTNWRLTEMQAAMGRALLRKVPDWVARRRSNAVYLTRRLQHISGLRVPTPAEHIVSAFYKYYIFVRPERLKPGWHRDRIMAEIEAMGIPCFSGSCSEVYEENVFKQAGIGPSRRHPNARELGETSLMFLVHPTLSEANLDDTCEAVESVMERASW